MRLMNSPLTRGWLPDVPVTIVANSDRNVSDEQSPYKYSRLTCVGRNTRNSVEETARRSRATSGIHTRGIRGLSFDNRTQSSGTTNLLLLMAVPNSATGIRLSSYAGML